MGEVPEFASLAEMRKRVELFICFIDLSNYKKVCMRLDDESIVEGINEYYGIVGRRMPPSLGTVLKFMGDAALIIFPSPAADTAVAALVDLKSEVDEAMERRGWECRLGIRGHVGEVILGAFGSDKLPFADVMGRQVNVAAMLPGSVDNVVLSAEAYERLSPHLQVLFTRSADGTYRRA